MLEQIVSGIHTRLYARAYIVADPSQDRCAPAQVSAKLKEMQKC